MYLPGKRHNSRIVYLKLWTSAKGHFVSWMRLLRNHTIPDVSGRILQLTPLSRERSCGKTVWVVLILVVTYMYFLLSWASHCLSGWGAETKDGSWWGYLSVYWQLWSSHHTMYGDPDNFWWAFWFVITSKHWAWISGVGLWRRFEEHVGPEGPLWK